MALFEHLERIAKQPAPFEFYSSPDLWNDPHISKGMLDAHLDGSSDVASFRTSKIDESVAWIADRFEIGDGTRVCDLGCGPGLWTARFAELGASVTGVDFSRRSIEHAGKTAVDRGLGIRYIETDYTRRDLDERLNVRDGFDLVTLINGDFSVLSPSQRTAVLDTVGRILVPGGAFLFDVCSASFFGNASRGATYAHFPDGGFYCPAPHHLFTHHFAYDDELLLCDKYSILSARREFDIYVWNQCYHVTTISAVVEAAELQVAGVCADVLGHEPTSDSDRIALIAEKPAGM